MYYVDVLTKFKNFEQSESTDVEDSRVYILMILYHLGYY